MKRLSALVLALLMAVIVCSFCVSAEDGWTAIAIDDSAAVYAAPSGGTINESIVIEGASLCTVIPDQDDAYAEVAFKGTGFRVYMLCNVQDGGNAVYNAPAVDVYIDGKASGKIEMIDITKFNWKNAADLVWEVTGLTDGVHMVKFVNSTVNDLPMHQAYFMGYEVYGGNAVPHDEVVVATEDPTTTEEPTTSTNPTTADISVVIAVVATLSGAGIVLGKKRK